MKTTDLNLKLIDTYFELLKNLSTDNKLELIARLSTSMKTKNKGKTGALKPLYGAFDSEQSADELISEIRNSRTFNRNRAEL